jgi:pimeloyl-ACP methyl ester carboxylesterase
MWAACAAALSERARVIALDCRGFGESSGAVASLLDVADDAAALLDALDITRAVVGGLSMGGYAALAFAARHPERLAGLLLADTRAGADSPQGRDARDAAIARIGAEGAVPYLDELVPKLLAPQAAPSLRQLARSLAGERPEALCGALAAMRDRPDRSHELAALRVPALVLVGAADALTPPDEARRMAAAIPGARLVELAGAGHLSCLESPAAFNGAVAELIASIP